MLPAFACVKDRDLPAPPVAEAPPAITPGILKVNEFVAASSTNVNEFGTASDWLELYNTSDRPLALGGGQWAVTDGGDMDAGKYVLPAMTIPARGYLVVWCDGLNTVSEQVHANFSLSSVGEEIAVHVLDGDGWLRIDGYAYADQNDGLHDNGQSNARMPDGGPDWTILQTPTPGTTND